MELPVTPSPRRGRRRSRALYWLRRIVLLLLLALPFLAWYGWTSFWDSLPVRSEAAAPRVVTSQPVYVLILGVDERDQDIGRSDTMLLVRLGPKRQFVELISIPRDTLATFPDGSRHKVNQAYHDGGPELAARVVANLLKIPQPYYVKVNLESFEKAVDILGGVELTVDRHYQYSDPEQNLEIDIKPGTQVMDGETALKYVRIRYDGVTNDDIARIARQQQFMEAVRSKLSSPVSWWKIPDLILTMRRYLATNVPEADQFGLAESLFKARGNLKMLTLPGEPDDETGSWMLDSSRWNEVVNRWSQQ